MITIITGATHTGKTMLAQKLLNKYNISYISLDHIKMGLIRSGFLSNSNDEDITDKIWPIVKEMIKTAIENKQNLIVEGCYIPFTWKDDFNEEYLKEIRYMCLCFNEEYIKNNIELIKQYGNCIENRIDDNYCTKELLIKENKRFIDGCESNKLSYYLIKDNYLKEIDQVIHEFK